MAAAAFLFNNNSSASPCKGLNCYIKIKNSLVVKFRLSGYYRIIEVKKDVVSVVFSSVEFILCFLPAFLLLYGLTPKGMKNLVLLVGSLVFYAVGDPMYLILLMASVLVNFLIGSRLGAVPGTDQGTGGRKGQKSKGRRQGRHRVEQWDFSTTDFDSAGADREYRSGREDAPDGRERQQAADRGYRVDQKKGLLVLAVLGNIGLLVLFKGGLGDAGLPLGISFYTFQILSYLVDVYKGDVAGEDSFVRFASYIVMFPQLISGPIVMYGEVRDALQERKFTAEGIQEGLKVFTAGLAAKVLLAERIGILWQEVQVTGFESISIPLAWMAAVAYSMKLYFDFYGYSLMAIGLGRMLGFALPENFQEPYMSGSVREFYRRWHMTLGRWFCKYVYIPLGGSRKGELRTVCNLLVVWLLTSIWHGGTPNFLIWGMLLWLFIVLERQLEALGFLRLFQAGPLRLIPRLYLWMVIPVTWMCFAITDVSQLQIFLGRMFGVVEGIRVSPGDWSRALGTYWHLFAIGGIACTPVLRKCFHRWKDKVPVVVLLVALFWLCIYRLQVEGQNPFMYFDY